MPCESVHQRARIVAEARMHHHAGTFVNHYDIVVFINDIERNILGYYLQHPHRIRKHYAYTVERLDLVARFDRLVAHQHVTRVGGGLYTATRPVGHALAQELVHPHGALALIDYDSEMLVHSVVVTLLVFGDQGRRQKLVFVIIYRLFHAIFPRSYRPWLYRQRLSAIRYVRTWRYFGAATTGRIRGLPKR